ncbi:hypothetical protein [Piscinibacterium candidicorallinum]|uniref:Uncharacterized protein n=1 Tax=Piscinibacterium candidicorallinum TaxID=1793872 RepID=A0ABV7H4C4_9BURK
MRFRERGAVRAGVDSRANGVFDVGAGIQSTELHQASASDAGSVQPAAVGGQGVALPAGMVSEFLAEINTFSIQ